MLPGDTRTFGQITVRAVPSYNIVKTNHPKSKNWLGYIVECGLIRIYAAGDTEQIPEMKNLGDISVAFLPIDGIYTMNTVEAAAAADDIQPDIAIPYHFNAPVNPQDFASRTSCPSRVLAVGQTISSEGWLQDFPLIGYWPLDEAAGSVAHDIASGNTGQVKGSAVWQPDIGRVKGTCQFDGTDDHIDAPKVLNPNSGPFSVFAWVKGTRANSVVISQADGTGSGRAWLACNDTGKLETRLTDGSAAVLTSDVVITDDSWHPIGIVWDGSIRHLYADGIEVAQDAMPIGKLLSADGHLYIGAGKSLAPSSRWLGMIDEVEIFNTAVIP